MTGLSVQSSSAIMNRLQSDGLLKREAPLRGRVGQPTVPVSLDPEGAFSLGLKIGRRSCDLVLIDFCGQIRRRASEIVRLSDARKSCWISSKSALPRVTSDLTPQQSRRIAGLGVASPFQLWSWEAEIGAPSGAMEGWRDISIADEIGRLCAYPITLCNDATSACAAEFFFGEAWRNRDFLYFFMGFFSAADWSSMARSNRAHGQRGGARLHADHRARRQRRQSIDRLGLDLPTREAHRGGGPGSHLHLARSPATGTLMANRWSDGSTIPPTPSRRPRSPPRRSSMSPRS